MLRAWCGGMENGPFPSQQPQGQQLRPPDFALVLLFGDDHPEFTHPSAGHAVLSRERGSRFEQGASLTCPCTIPLNFTGKPRLLLWSLGTDLPSPKLSQIHFCLAASPSPAAFLTARACGQSGLPLALHHSGSCLSFPHHPL